MTLITLNNNNNNRKKNVALVDQNNNNNNNNRKTMYLWLWSRTQEACSLFDKYEIPTNTYA